MTKRWYTNSNENDLQGLITDEEDGKNIAVSFDVKDAFRIARAPEMEEVLRNLLRYLLAGAIKTKKDRYYCIRMIDDVLCDLPEPESEDEE